MYTSLTDILLVLDPWISYTVLKKRLCNNSTLDVYLELAKQDLHEYYMAPLCPIPNQPMQISHNQHSINHRWRRAWTTLTSKKASWQGNKKVTSTATNKLEQYYQYLSGRLWLLQPTAVVGISVAKTCQTCTNWCGTLWWFLVSIFW